MVSRLNCMEKCLLPLKDTGSSFLHRIGHSCMVHIEAPITVPNGHAHSWGGVASGVEEVRAMVRKRVVEDSDVYVTSLIMACTTRCSS